MISLQPQNTQGSTPHLAVALCSPLESPGMVPSTQMPEAASRDPLFPMLARLLPLPQERVCQTSTGSTRHRPLLALERG